MLESEITASDDSRYKIKEKKMPLSHINNRFRIDSKRRCWYQSTCNEELLVIAGPTSARTGKVRPAYKAGDDIGCGNRTTILVHNDLPADARLRQATGPCDVHTTEATGPQACGSTPFIPSATMRWSE